MPSNCQVIAAGDYLTTAAATKALFTAARDDGVTCYWLGLGDHAYQCGSYVAPSGGDFGTGFKADYDAYVIKAGHLPEDQFLFPTPGSHDWGKRGTTVSPACSNASLSGYASYFGTAKGMFITTGQVAELGYYYSHDLKAADGSQTRWRLIVLDVVKAVGSGGAADGMCIGCWGPNTRPGGVSQNSTQYDWLATKLDEAIVADLNVIVTFAHPYYSRRTANHYAAGNAGEKGSADMVKLIQTKRPGRAVIVSSHQHNYQRSKQLNPNTGDSVDTTNGLWQFVAGIATGNNQGYDFNADGAVDALFQASRDTAGGAQNLSGALYLVLKDTSVDFTYKTNDGTTRDSGTLTLNVGGGTTNPPQTAPAETSGPTDGSVQAPGVAAFGWAAVTAATGYKYRVDGGTTIDNGSTRTAATASLGAGTHTFEAWAYNAGGDGPHLLVTWTVSSSNQPTIIDTVQVVQTTPAWSSADKEIGRVDAICFDPVNQILYVGGNFHGANSVKKLGGALATRNYLMAIDWTTKELVDSWVPEPNGRVYALWVSPDGARVYVGGDFTSIGSTPGTRHNLACINAAIGGNAGTLSSTMADLAFNGSVRALAPADNNQTLFVGGNFTAPATTGRRLCKLDISGAAAAIVATWKPTAGVTTGSLQAVKGLHPDPLTNRLVVCGDWTNLNGAAVNYIGCIRQDGNGETLGWTDHPADRAICLDANPTGTEVVIGTVNDRIEKYAVATGVRSVFEDTDGNVQALAWDPAGWIVGGMHGDCIGNAAGAASGSYSGGSCGVATGIVRHKAWRMNDQTFAYDQAWDPSLTGGPTFGVLGVWAAHVSGGVVWLGGDFGFAGGVARNRLTAISTAAVAPPPPTGGVVVIDTFNRTLAAGNTFGTADTGETTVKDTGNNNLLSVDGAAGVMPFPIGGGTFLVHYQRDAVDLAATDVDETVRFSLDQLPVVGNLTFAITARQVDSNQYVRGRVTVTPAGACTMACVRRVGGVDTVVANQSIALVVAAGQKYNLRYRVSGSTSVAHDVKLWQDGLAEPGSFDASGTDATPGSGSGSIGYRVQSVATVTNAVTVRIDNLSATQTEISPPPPPDPQPESITWDTGSTFAEGTTAATGLIPSSAADGDLVLAHVTAVGAAAIVAPAGWTLLAPISADGTAIATAVYGRVKVAGDANPAFSCAGATSLTVNMKAANGVDPATPVRVGATNNSGGTAGVAPAGSALSGLSAADEIVTFFASAAGPRPWPDAGGMVVGVQPVPTDWATQTTVAAIEAVALRKLAMASSMVPWDCHTGIANGDFGAAGRGPAHDFANNRLTYVSWPRPRPGANGSESSWQSVFGTQDPSTVFAQIAGGTYDGIIDGNANAYKTFGHPIILRLFHEMNGGGIIWGIGMSTQQASYGPNYVAACKRIIDRTLAIAKNVYFHWNPQNFATVSGVIGARDGMYWDDVHAAFAGTELYMSPGDTATSVLQNTTSNGQTYPAIYAGYGLGSSHAKLLGNGEGGNRYQGTGDATAAAARIDSLQALSGFPDWRFMIWWNGLGSNGNSDIISQPAGCQTAFQNWLASARTKPALVHTFLPIAGQTQEYETRRSLGGAAQTNIGAGMQGTAMAHAPQVAAGSSAALAASTYGYGKWASVTLALKPVNPNPPPPPPPPPPPGTTPTVWWGSSGQVVSTDIVTQEAAAGRAFVANRMNINMVDPKVGSSDTQYDAGRIFTYRNSNWQTAAPKQPISWAEVAAGLHDDLLITFFQNLLADTRWDGSTPEKTFYYSPHHEQTINNPPSQVGWSALGFPSGCGTIPEFVDQFRHVRALADSMGVTRRKINGTPNGGKCDFVFCGWLAMFLNPPTDSVLGGLADVAAFDPDGTAKGTRPAVAPGSSYYEVFGMDHYNSWIAANSDLKWGQDAHRTLDPIRNYALAKGKDWILPECGIGDSTEQAAHNACAAFIRSMRDVIKGYGSVSPGVCRSVMWTPEANPAPTNYAFDSSPEKTSAIQEMGNDPFFMAGLLAPPPPVQAPSVGITTPLAGVTVSGTTVNVIAVAAEQNGGIAQATLQVNHGPATPMTPLQVDALGNGTYIGTATLQTGAAPGAANTLQVQAVDRQSSPAMATSPEITVFAVAQNQDVDGPTLLVTNPPGGADLVTEGANGTAITITGTVSDPSGIHDLAVTLPNASVVHPTVAADGGWSVTTTLATGANFFQVDASDNSPLQNGTHAEFTITLNAPAGTDTTGPILGLTAPQGEISIAGPVGSLFLVSGTVADPSGIQSVTVNGVAVVVTSSAFSRLITLVAGANAVTVVATDNSANHNQTTVVHTITLFETLGPTLIVSTPPADQIISGSPGQTYIVSGNVVSTHGITSLTVNGTPIGTDANGNFSTVVPLQAGANTIAVVATDAQTVPQSTSITRTITLSVPPPADDVTVLLSSDEKRIQQQLEQRGLNQ